MNTQHDDYGLTMTLNNQAQKANGGSLVQQMQQLSLDLDDSPNLCEVIAQTQEPEYPDVLTCDPEDLLSLSHQSETEMQEQSIEPAHHTLYLKFALSMLVTCCEDLSEAQQILGDHKASDRKKNQARERQEMVLAWLNDCEAPFTFQQCTQLLEEELSLQSLGQVTIPHIEERRAELANWMKSNPEHARHYLKHYARIFSVDSINSFEDVEKSRSSHPRHREELSMRL